MFRKIIGATNVALVPPVAMVLYHRYNYYYYNIINIINITIIIINVLSVDIVLFVPNLMSF